MKGYEFAKGQYVKFTPEEIKALEEAGSETIDITEFLPIEKVDPLYFEKAYYVGPDKGGDKPYRLLAEAMRKTKRAAIATWAARGKQYLVLIRPFEDGLMLQQLRYAEEIKSFEEVERGKGDVKPAELNLAVQLVEQISADAFHPEHYHDGVATRDRSRDPSQGRGRRGDRGGERGARVGADHRSDGSAEGEPRRRCGRAARPEARAGGREARREARASGRFQALEVVASLARSRALCESTAMADEREAASFSVEQVAGLLGLGAAQLRTFVRNGFVEPARGPRGELRFSFQDLVFLRVVARLADARISPRRMERAVRGLRARLPGDRPLSGVRLSAAGANVVVREHDRTWSPESGQYWFEFETPGGVDRAARRAAARRGGTAAQRSRALEVTATAEGWYVFGCEVEASNPDAARAAYARALELDPGLAEAHVNWGCLEHEAGRLAEAEAQYRAALAIRPDDATAAFDLAVVLEDRGRGAEARAAYETALALDPTAPTRTSISRASATASAKRAPRSATSRRTASSRSRSSLCFRIAIASSGGGTFGQNIPQAATPQRCKATPPSAEDVLDERPAAAPHGAAMPIGDRP